MFESHDMRQIFRRLTGGQRDTLGLGRNKNFVDIVVELLMNINRTLVQYIKK